LAVAGISTTAPAPKSPQPVEKASKKGKAVAIAVVAIIIVAAIAVGLVLFAFSGPPEQGAASPEQAFNSFIDSLNRGDAEDAIAKTVFTFDENSAEYIEGLSQNLAGAHLTLLSGPNIFSEQMMNATEKVEIAARVAEIESKYGVDVTEFSVAAFRASVSSLQGSMTIEERLPCVLIEGKWYIDAKKLFDDQGPDGDEGGPDQPIQVSLSNGGQTPEGNWTIVVVGVTSDQTLQTTAVYLEVKNSTGDIKINLVQLTGSYSDVIFDDGDPMGELNTGDNFILDGIVFDAGSRLTLKDSSGETVYGEVTL